MNKSIKRLQNIFFSYNPAFLPVTVFIVFFSSLCLAGGHSHKGHHPTTDDVMAHNPVVNTTLPGVVNSAAYLTIMNHSDKAVTLIGAEGEVSNQVEVHEHAMVDGLMRMQKIKAITIDAGASLHFEPGGYHIMFLGVKQPIQTGDKVVFYLVFEGGKKIKVEAPAKEQHTTSHKHHGHKHHHHKHH